MSIHASAWAKTVTHAPSGEPITKTEKLFLLVVADYVNAETGVAWPSVARLARECLMSQRNVRYVAQSLEAKGLLRIERIRKDDGSNANNRYRFPAMAPESQLSVAPVSQPAQLKASDIAAALTGPGGILEGYLADFADQPAAAYRATLDAADLLAAEHAGVSKDLRGYLRNAIVAHVALDVAELDGKAIGRLNREAKALGESGPLWLITALLRTASANVEGDLASYAIAAARRMKQEASA
jgi:hypothetical protein